MYFRLSTGLATAAVALTAASASAYDYYDQYGQGHWYNTPYTHTTYQYSSYPSYTSYDPYYYHNYNNTYHNNSYDPYRYEHHCDGPYCNTYSYPSYNYHNECTPFITSSRCRYGKQYHLYEDYGYWGSTYHKKKHKDPWMYDAHWPVHQYAAYHGDSWAKSKHEMVNVDISSHMYHPERIVIRAGSKVTWTNRDRAPHTVTSDNRGVFDSGRFSQGQKYTVTFLYPGTFHYHCDLHPGMEGTVVVLP
jgi:plastocyanin